MKLGTAVIQEKCYLPIVTKQEALSHKCGMQENLQKDYVFLIAHTRICFPLFNFLFPIQCSYSTHRIRQVHLSGAWFWKTFKKIVSASRGCEATVLMNWLLKLPSQKFLCSWLCEAKQQTELLKHITTPACWEGTKRGIPGSLQKRQWPGEGKRTALKAPVKLTWQQVLRL